jgi:hypothetical protein
MMDLRCVDVACVLSTELWCISDYMTCRLGTLAKVYSGLMSLTFCSQISVFLLLEKNVCKIISNSSFCFLCCMVLVVYVMVCISLFILHCSECAMRMLRLGYLCSCILCVRDVVFLLTFQFGQHVNYYTFCISVYI